MLMGNIATPSVIKSWSLSSLLECRIKTTTRPINHVPARLSDSRFLHASYHLPKHSGFGQRFARPCGDWCLHNGRHPTPQMHTESELILQVSADSLTDVNLKGKCWLIFVGKIDAVAHCRVTASCSDRVNEPNVSHATEPARRYRRHCYDP